MLKYFLLFLSIPSLYTSPNPTSITDPVYSLISRITPSLSSKISIIYIPSSIDTFTINATDTKVQIIGNSQISLSVGFNYYLTKYLNSSISWTGDNLDDIPEVIPLDINPTTKTRTFKYTYYLNVCTFSYSMVWWDWSRWEREIDFMAMRGINMALAFTGQEYIYLQTMQEFQIPEAEILQEYFSGPAFLAWQRMGNIRSWGGPLRKSWIEKQYQLQLLILKRMKELGIKAILPAFSGFVPRSLKEKFSEADINQAEAWNGFPENLTKVYMVEPVDPLFKIIAKKFTDNLIKFFGPTDHLYNGDQFNEVDPSSNSTEYLQNAGKAMIEGLQSSDPEAIWVLQGWLFSYSSFWKDPTLIQAYLSKIDEKSIIILDLYSEVWPIYNKTNSYFGKPYIWNELHDFGGNLGLYGKIPTLIDEPFKALYTPNSSLVGVGITMEGIYQNMIVYDLVLDIAWMEHSIDPMLWIKDYIKSRYGTINEESYSAWFLLLDSVYNCSDNRRDVTTSLIEKRPNLNFVNNLYYNPKKVIKAARKLIGFAIDRKEKCTEGLLFDITDVSRQVLSDLFSDYYYKDLLISVKNKDLNRYIETSVKMIEIIDDLDILLGTRKEFLLGNWIKDAEKWGGDNENDTRHYRFNAINQITMWGPTSNINDYASKQWNGLMKSYYYVRWCRFFEEILKSLNDGKEFDQIAFDGSIGEFEIDWNYNYNEIFSGETLGGSVDIASMLWEKYDKDFDRFK